MIYILPLLRINIHLKRQNLLSHQQRLRKSAARCNFERIEGDLRMRGDRRRRGCRGNWTGVTEIGETRNKRRGLRLAEEYLRPGGVPVEWEQYNMS